MSELPPFYPQKRKAKRRAGVQLRKNGKIKRVKNGVGRPSDYKAKIKERLERGYDAAYSKGYSLPHSIHEALNKSGLVELLRELGVDGVKVLREDADRKQLTINKLEEKIHERDVIINRYRVQEHRFKKAPKISKELGGLPEDTTDIELVMCLHLIKQFRAQQSKELYVNRLKFAIGVDPLDGLNSLLKSGQVND